MPLAFDTSTLSPSCPSASCASLSRHLTQPSPNTRFVGQTVADVERHLILDTLDYCQGNRTHAAKILGISIRTLRNKLNEYNDSGIEVPEPGRIRERPVASM